MTRCLAASFARRYGLSWMRSDLEAVALEAAWEAVRKRGAELDDTELSSFIRHVAWRRCLDAVRAHFGRHGTSRSSALHVSIDHCEPPAAPTAEDEVVAASLEDEVVTVIETHFDEREAEVLLAPLRGSTLEAVARSRGVTGARVSQIRRAAQDRLRTNTTMTELLLTS